MIIFLVIVCTVVYSASVWVSAKYSYYKSGMWEWEVKDFSDNRAHFALLANNLYRYFEEEYENDSRLASVQILTAGEEWELHYSYGDAAESKTARVGMSDDERESMEKIQDALHHKYAGFSCILIQPERVTFATVYYYAVIWSRNGKKPAFLFSPGEDGTLFCNRLSLFSNKWYQCILK